MDGLGTQAGMATLSGFNPLTLNPVLWLDGSDTSTMFDAVTGGSPVSDGGAVSRWEDKSTNSNHAIKTSNTAPTLDFSIKNGLSALDFDIGRGLSTPLDLLRPYTVVLVGHQYSTGNRRIIQSNSTNVIFSLSRSSNNVHLNGTVQLNPLVSSGVSAIATLRVSSSETTTLYANGTIDKAAASPASIDLGVLTLGQDGSSNDSASAYIYEILAFPSYLADADWQSLQVHLADKWDITLT